MSDDGSATAIAVGWATVEFERAEAAFASLLEPGSRFEAVADCAVLGARCRIGRTAADLPAPGGSAARTVVLLEPSTEGRLAAFLARHGEGWCATWTPSADADAPDVTAGPFGPERLALGSPIAGPFRLLVRPATIRS